MRVIEIDRHFAHSYTTNCTCTDCLHNLCKCLRLRCWQGFSQQFSVYCGWKTPSFTLPSQFFQARQFHSYLCILVLPVQGGCFNTLYITFTDSYRQKSFCTAIPVSMNVGEEVVLTKFQLCPSIVWKSYAVFCLKIKYWNIQYFVCQAFLESNEFENL